MSQVVNDNQQKYFHSFNLIEGLGPANFQKIIKYFNSLEEAWQANIIEFYKAKLEKTAIEGIKYFRPKINPDKELEKVKQENIEVLTIADKKYPQLLKQIYSPPPVLYLRGEIKTEDNFSIGVVGTRKLSFYGKQITPQITSQLVQNNLTIVSGLAKGIDTLAHKTAVENSSRTIAVLGSGIDDRSIYPAVNKNLAKQIIQNGALISEFPPNTIPSAGNFPKRNRIISGISLGTLVIEAPIKSGALITAKDALEQNREIFTVPGNVFSPNSKGPHKLIKMGAKLTEEVNDILEELNLPNSETTKKIIPKPANAEEKLILDELSQTNSPLHIDKIIQKTKLPITTASSTLSLMEIRGKIKNLGAGKYSL